MLQYCEHIFVYVDTQCLQVYAVSAPFELPLNFPYTFIKFEPAYSQVPLPFFGTCKIRCTMLKHPLRSLAPIYLIWLCPVFFLKKLWDFSKIYRLQGWGRGLMPILRPVYVN